MRQKPQIYWIMRHWKGHAYPDTLRVQRKDCCEAFRQNYREKHDNHVHRPIKVTLQAATRLSELQERVKVLEEALKPFGEYVAKWESVYEAELCRKHQCMISAGYLLDARAALTQEKSDG